MQKEDMSIVIVGHVDHGKSTIIGRLLADTDSLPQGKLEQVREKCRRNSKPFEYAFLLDSLRDEQEQGITIDSARCFFKTEKRNYILIDAPGHIEFLKNMVTGASRAEAALLVIDANEGIKENSKTHGYLLSMLGIKQLCVLVNKMDLVDYDNKRYDNIVKEYSEFLTKINVIPSHFIPVSGFKGENILNKSENMPWYVGSTLLKALDDFISEKIPKDKPFRMPVQGVYKFTKEGDDRRIVAGTVETGVLNIGDEVCFYPSGKKSTVKTIEVFNAERRVSVSAGDSTGFTLDEQIYVKRGEMVGIAGQRKPQVTTRMKVNLFWLGKKPLEKNKEYYLKLGTAKVSARVEEILMVLDASSLDTKAANQINRNEVAECILVLDKEIAFDTSKDMASTGRFVIVDSHDIAGGGIVLEALEDKQDWLREKVILRNYKWEKSEISDKRREEKYKQKSALILITGEKNVGKKALAKELEKRLFEDGRIVYFLGIGNVLYGVDADIKNILDDKKEEHLRRLAEVAHLMMDAGIILIVTAVNLNNEDLKIMKTITNTEKIETILIGDYKKSDLNYSLNLSDINSLEDNLNRIGKLLKNKGVIY
jgi:bifunctional enzyme CysN/CysC